MTMLELICVGWFCLVITVGTIVSLVMERIERNNDNSLW